MLRFFFFFFFNDTATTEIYTLSLHDALPIYGVSSACHCTVIRAEANTPETEVAEDRKSTRLNSSHVAISYAVFCLKKKKKNKKKKICNQKKKNKNKKEKTKKKK